MMERGNPAPSCQDLQVRHALETSENADHHGDDSGEGDKRQRRTRHAPLPQSGEQTCHMDTICHQSFHKGSPSVNILAGAGVEPALPPRHIVKRQNVAEGNGTVKNQRKQHKQEEQRGKGETAA